jgi:hypothetical protein
MAFSLREILFTLANSLGGLLNSNSLNFEAFPGNCCNEEIITLKAPNRDDQEKIPGFWKAKANNEAFLNVVGNNQPGWQVYVRNWLARPRTIRKFWRRASFLVRFR